MVLTRKHLLLIGFILVLLIGIPATLFVVQQQQEIRSRAEKSTTLYFQPDSTQTAPIERAVDETFALDVYANPGNNLITTMRLEIDYDPEILEVAEGTGSTAGFVPDPGALPSIMFGPVYTPGKIVVTLSTGGNPAGSVDTITKIGTINFTAIAETAGTPTEVSYGSQTLVTSGGDDSVAAENVLSAANPAFIIVTAAEAPTSTPTPTAARTPTPSVTGTSSGTEEEVADEKETAQPELTEAPTATPTATLVPPTSTPLPQDTPTPTLEPTGPGDTIVGFGFAITVLAIIGSVLFFAL